MNIINKIKQKIFPFTHSIVLKNGKKLNCRSSLEATLYEDENEKHILILDSSVNFKRKIITINKDDKNDMNDLDKINNIIKTVEVENGYIVIFEREVASR